MQRAYHMVKSTIIANPVSMAVSISKAAQDSWLVRPYFTAFPAPLQPHPKNIIFLLDTSSSMRSNSRLQRVKVAVSNLLDKLKPTDTFSVVSFNETATHLVTCKPASKQEIVTAKSLIDKMEASYGTSFEAAFSSVNKPNMIPSDSHSSIIFLTDGEDNSCSAQKLFQIFKGKKFLHIIPIGILEGTSPFLDALATLSGGGSRALYIKDAHSTEYQQAFDTAFQRTTEQSRAPAQLDMTIQARDKTSVSVFQVTRTLDPVSYDGTTATRSVLYFNSPIPPQYLKFCFRSEDRSLQSEHKLTVEEYSKLNQGQSIVLTISSFKWKNNSLYSWLIALGNIALGLLLLAGVTLFVLSFPQLSLALWQPLVIAGVGALTGSFLLLCGMLAIVRKTVLLPTKYAAEANKCDDSLDGKQVAPPATYRGSLGFFPKVLTGAVLAGCGATAGYYGGNVLVTANVVNAVLATGISPFLFMSGCAVASAIALPLLVYGCVQMGMQPLTESSSLAMC